MSDKNPQIYICDAIMGSGKTSAAINYMRAHPEQRFIYVAVFCDEDQRIADACPELRFAIPDDHGKANTKTSDFVHLLSAKRNIATTHALFSLCDERIAELVAAGGYTMIIDEAIDVARQCNMRTGDRNVLEQLGVLSYSEDGTVLIDEEKAPEGESCASECLLMARAHKLVRTGSTGYFYWFLTDTMIKACDQVIIMTYLFDRSPMANYLQLYGFNYSKLYVRHPAEGTYEFCLQREYIPEYVGRLKELITVVQKRRFNVFADAYNVLSASWCGKWVERRRGKIVGLAKMPDGQQNPLNQVASLLRSYFRYEYGDAPAEDRVWSCYGDYAPFLGAKGYLGSFLEFNAKSFNCYSDRHTLAYLVNVFLDPNIKIYFHKHGVEMDDEGYPLTTMIQWIWRSAIRKGEPITLYLPSKRMRDMLFKWMDECVDDYNRFYNIKEIEE